jgi:phosphoglycerate dehydrogenase-like enzyme
MNEPGRRRVGIALTSAARDRYFFPASIDRLERYADVEWLEFDGPSRTAGPPPDDPASVARLTGFVHDLDALVVSYGAPRVTPDVLDAAPGLRFIGDTHGDRFGARVEVGEALRRGILVSDTTNGSSDPVAEWALALMLIGLRNAGSHFRRLVAGEVLWPDRDVLLSDPGYLNGELAGKTVGLLALGNVGRRLVELLAPFGVRVLAFDPYADAALAQSTGVELVSLERVVAEPDVVVCLVPLTTQTRGLLGRREFGSMKPGALFVNVSRGAVVDTAALVDRLRLGDLIASIDVVEPEPLEGDSPLRSMPNVFLSPHIAGVTAAAEPRFFDLMVDELVRWIEGQALRFPLVLREDPLRSARA